MSSSNRPVFIESQAPDELISSFYQRDAEKPDLEWYHATLELFFHYLVRLDRDHAVKCLHALDREFRRGELHVTGAMWGYFSGAAAAYAWVNDVPCGPVLGMYDDMRNHWGDWATQLPSSAGEALVHLHHRLFQVFAVDEMPIGDELTVASRLHAIPGQTPTEEAFNKLSLALLMYRTGSLARAQRLAEEAGQGLVGAHRHWRMLADLVFAGCIAAQAANHRRHRRNREAMTAFAAYESAQERLLRADIPLAFAQVALMVGFYLSLERDNLAAAEGYSKKLAGKFRYGVFPFLISYPTMLPALGARLGEATRLAQEREREEEQEKGKEPAGE